jgi:hypothetical protein
VTGVVFVQFGLVEGVNPAICAGSGVPTGGVTTIEIDCEPDEMYSAWRDVDAVFFAEGVGIVILKVAMVLVEPGIWGTGEDDE